MKKEKDMIYAARKKHLDIFAQACDYWLGQLGLQDYICGFQLESIGDNESVVSFWKKANLAIFALNRKLDVKPTTKRLYWIAMHECLHLLLSRLIGMTPKNFHDKSEGPVRILCKLIAGVASEKIYEKWRL
jgi:hypothetical protein